MESRLEQAIDAAKLYYGRGVSQEDVARTLGVSRPTVSKLIQLAKERGFVTVAIHDPREATSKLGVELSRRYGLEAVRLAVGRNDPAAPYDQVGGVGAALLEELVQDRDRIGVAWGGHVHATARYLRPGSREGVEVVALEGGRPDASLSAGEHETITLLCDAFNAHPWVLHLPARFDNPAIVRLVHEERVIRQVLDLGSAVDTAVFTVEAVDPAHLGQVSGSLTARELAEVRDRAVARVCSRYVDEAGKAVSPTLEARTIAVGLDDLRAKRRRICIGGGRERSRALQVALAAGFVTHLVTDVAAAEGILAHEDRSVSFDRSRRGR